MKIACIYNNNSDIPSLNKVNKNFDNTVYDLRVGREYYVFAACISEGVLQFLIDSDDDERATWYPLDLFSTGNFVLPSEWQFGFYPAGEKGPISAIWGYQEIVESNDHFDGLADRIDADRDVFKVRKAEMLNSRNSADSAR